MPSELADADYALVLAMVPIPADVWNAEEPVRRSRQLTLLNPPPFPWPDPTPFVRRRYRRLMQAG
jgi:hypothetical protein